MTLPKQVYEFILLAGFFGTIFLYAFDDFSETELVRLSYGWIAAIVFGSHGLMATEVNDVMKETEANTHKEALRTWSSLPDRSLLSKLSTVLIWSYHLVLLLVDGRRPFLLALMAAVLWTVLLSGFFEGIFPAL